MNISYDKASILQGNMLRRENEERPVTFAEVGGAADPQPSANLDVTSQRMAGPVGSRALELMNNPVSRAATENWQELFSQSNEGGIFNQEKMLQATERDTYLSTNKQLGKG